VNDLYNRVLEESMLHSAPQLSLTIPAALVYVQEWLLVLLVPICTIASVESVGKLMHQCNREADGEAHKFVGSLHLPAYESFVRLVHHYVMRLVVIFAAIKPDENSDSQCHGIHYVSQEEFGERVFFRGDSSRLPPRSDHQHHYIILNQAYRDYFSNSSKRTATKDVRTCFLLATTLVHELAHAFYARNIIDGVEDYEEPFLSAEQADLAPELGCALDTQLYGAKTESIIDPIHGGYLEHWPILYTSKDDTVVYSRTHVIFPVSSSWFYLWFQEETWNMITAAPVEQQLQAFHIPRTDEGAARSSLKTGNFDWKRRRALIGKDRRMKAIEDYEEKNRIALQAELDDV
jgi:hypothetical protein